MLQLHKKEIKVRDIYMVKGCERRLVIYKSKNSKYFSEVHFIMKEDLDGKKENRRDIIAEANKIVDEANMQGELGGRKRKKLSKLLFFLLGCAFSSAFFLILAHFNII